LGAWALRVGRRGEPLLVEQQPEGPWRLREREGWYAAFVGVLLEHGADESVTVAAVDHLADLFMVTPRKHWEDAARCDPVLARLGLTPDQCGALVALLAGSRRDREAGRGGGLLGAVRAGHDRCFPVELTPAEQKRVRTYVDGTNPAHRRPAIERRPPVLGEAVRAEMARSGVTQEMIAARLGIRRQNVSTRLAGVVAWTTDELAAVADLLEVPVTRLLNNSQAQSRSLGPQGDAPGRSRARTADRTMTPARPDDRLTALAR
jgi:transcriptional regulator with XRE-family HTH domain